MLKDYKEFDHDLLQLPINGKLYTIPQLGAADAARIQLEQDDPDSVKLTAAELRACVLGSAYDEMLADNVPAPAIGRALLTAMADGLRGRQFAELMWETGADPKAIARKVKKSVKTSTPSTSTGAENETPSPVSTSGTKRPAKSPKPA